MSIAAPSTPADCFAALLRWLSHFVVTRRLTGQLSQHLASAIIDRIRGINQRFAHIAARVGAGRYAPRRSSPRRTARRAPRPPSPLPQTKGWLLALVPEATQSRAQLEHLLRDPAMAALLAAAPVSLARPLRSLCRMLRVDPPTIPPPLVPVPPQPAPTQPAVPPPPALAPPPLPAAPRPPAPSPHACGPPFPA